VLALLTNAIDLVSTRLIDELGNAALAALR